jgi:hypothetical protein
MTSKQTMFFSTSSDIKPILKNIEELYKIQYYKMGMFDNTKDIMNYKSFSLIDKLGFTIYGDWNLIDRYLIIQQKAVLNIRDVHQRKGGIKYVVDQVVNAASIEFKMGGIYTEKNDVLVAGRIATASNGEFSNKLYKSFATMVKEQFRRVGSFYVGNEALEKLKAGWRLVTNEQLSKEFDLIFE